MKPQDMCCKECGSRWVGTSAVCPNGCETIAKSQGEMTRKTLQGESDLKKGLR